MSTKVMQEKIRTAYLSRDIVYALYAIEEYFEKEGIDIDLYSLIQEAKAQKECLDVATEITQDLLKLGEVHNLFDLRTLIMMAIDHKKEKENEPPTTDQICQSL